MSRLLRVRSTINMAGLRAGQVAYVDPDDDFIRVCLQRGILVALDTPAIRPPS